MINYRQNDYYTITIQTQNITNNDAENLLREIKCADENNILIDMKNVEKCVNNFFKIFTKTNKKISIINTDSQILAALYIMNFDKYIDVYNERVSFQYNKNKLTNRHLAIVK